jgi:hypothetical protein
MAASPSRKKGVSAREKHALSLLRLAATPRTGKPKLEL